MSDPHASAVSIVSACVHYDDFRAVDTVSLDVAAGTVHVLLGHSGSGKTTLLRAIAGFEPLTAGRIVVGGRTVDDGTRSGWVAPEARRIGFVFQDYALFTHLDALGNVAFGASGSRADRRAAAADWLTRVHLADHGSRRPGELSGGEQQRVALVRALAQRPALVLLDEPFSNLDPHLRRSVRDDTIALIRENQATAIFVTHDVEEAFSVGDALSVLEAGRIVQTGTPEEIYGRPVSRHVAQLCGPATFVTIDDVTADGRAVCVLGEVDAVGDVEPGGVLVVRPEHVVVAPGDDATVARRRFLGSCEELELELAGGQTLVARHAPVSLGANTARVTLRGTIAAVRDPTR